MSVGLIVNPKAGKKRTDGMDLAKKLEGAEGVHVSILENFDDLTGMLDEFAKHKIETLFISSGDGTVQAILTDIAERGMFKPFPKLALLPHGTTNLSSKDLGFKLKKVGEQAAFIRAAGLGTAAKDVRQRNSIRVANPADGLVRHGFFIGNGATWKGTVVCQVDVHKKGLMGSWATFAVLAQALFKGAFYKPDPNDDSRIDRPWDMAIMADGETKAGGAQLFYMASTLQQLILGVRPFWGGASAPMRSTVVPYPPPNLLRWSWAVMMGGENRTPAPGAQSFCADVVEIAGDSPFVIDGEFFEPRKDEPLRLETGPVFSFVCG